MMKKPGYEIQKRTLENGTDVILIRKPDYVQSFFLCGFGTGGFYINEKIGDRILHNRTGCAHFLEHQMFRYKGQDVTELFARMQSQTNAFTSYTETAYYFSTTASIDQPLKLLMNFVQDLDIDEQTVEKEKGIILSEYAMYDQNPEYRLLKECYESMYFHHPLHTDILGTVEDIEHMTVRDLQTFYKNNYDPGEMVMVGITGHELGPVFQVIEEHEKNFSSHIDHRAECVFEEEPDSVKRPFYSMNMDVTEPYIALAYKMHGYDEIGQCLRTDVAVSLWLDCVFGPVNPNYQTWLDEHIISQLCGAESDFSRDHGYVLFYAQTSKQERFKEIVQSIAGHRQNVEEESFESLKIQMKARNLRSLDNFESLAIENMRAHLEGYDYFEAIEIVESLSWDEVQNIVSSLDFSHVCEVQILPQREKTIDPDQ